MKVAYAGPEQHEGYELSAADFKKAGVEHKKTFFPTGEPVEVPDEVGELLVNPNDSVLDEIPFVQVEEDGEGVEQAEEAVETNAKKAAKTSDSQGEPKSGKKAVAKSASDDAGTPTTAGSAGTTGAGTSTSTRA